MIYNTFTEWVISDVLPLREKNPGLLRLDGSIAGGNRKIFGRFRHNGRVWVVNSDTRIDSICRAYNAIQEGGVVNPFVVERAKTRDCLNLLPGLRVPKQPKHFYVYEQVQGHVAANTA